MASQPLTIKCSDGNESDLKSGVRNSGPAFCYYEMEVRPVNENYAIELKNITKQFGKVIANDKVSLSVKRGEILSILGENGSGKTSLMI